MKDSKIEWCDHTFNPWMGCTKVSPGCEHCYAENFADRFQLVKWGPGNPRKRTTLANWKQPLSWNREYENDNAASQSVGHGSLPRPRVFCASLADWLDHEAPVEWLADLLDLIRITPSLDWLLLTKRPQNWLERVGKAADYIMRRGGDYRWIFDWCVIGIAPANVWIGTTVEDQTRADQRIPELLKIPARVRFLSCEPLLGPVCLWSDANYKHPNGGVGSAFDWGNGVHWVICGGESGPNARPMHPNWARSLRDECAAAQVPYLFKQWGEWLPHGQSFAGVSFQLPKSPDWHSWEDGMRAVKIGKKLAGRELDGVDHYAFPEGVT